MPEWNNTLEDRANGEDPRFIGRDQNIDPNAKAEEAPAEPPAETNGGEPEPYTGQPEFSDDNTHDGEE